MCVNMFRSTFAAAIACAAVWFLQLVMNTKRSRVQGTVGELHAKKKYFYYFCLFIQRYWYLYMCEGFGVHAGCFSTDTYFIVQFHIQHKSLQIVWFVMHQSFFLTVLICSVLDRHAVLFYFGEIILWGAVLSSKNVFILKALKIKNNLDYFTWERKSVIVLTFSVLTFLTDLQWCHTRAHTSQSLTALKDDNKSVAWQL